MSSIGSGSRPEAAVPHDPDDFVRGIELIERVADHLPPPDVAATAMAPRYPALRNRLFHQQDPQASANLIRQAELPSHLERFFTEQSGVEDGVDPYTHVLGALAGYRDMTPVGYQATRLMLASLRSDGKWVTKNFPGKEQNMFWWTIGGEIFQGRIQQEMDKDELYYLALGILAHRRLSTKGEPASRIVAHALTEGDEEEAIELYETATDRFRPTTLPSLIRLVGTMMPCTVDMGLLISPQRAEPRIT